MSSPLIALTVYCGLILLASLAGGWIPMLVRLTHERMEMAVSFVAGVMLGIGVLHMLPHAVLARVDAASRAAGADFHFDHESIHEMLGPLLLWLLAGFLVMFLIQRFFHFHTHEAPSAALQVEQSARPQHHHHNLDDHRHHHDHADQGHAPQTSNHDAETHPHELTWSAAAIGLSLHSLIEGVALASSIEALRQGGAVGAAGLGTFFVIFLHKPFDSLTIGTLMSLGRQSRHLRHGVNIAFSLLVPVGALLFYLGLWGAGEGEIVTSSALAFSAGTFLCIAMSDLLPELQFHQHDRVKLSAALFLGLAIAWGISAIESRTHEAIAAAAIGHGLQHLSQ